MKQPQSPLETIEHVVGNDRAHPVGMIRRFGGRRCAMPNDVKAAVSVIVLIVAAVLAFWSGSPVRPEFSTFVMATAIFMIVAMWIFPEAGVKKGDLKKPK